MIRCIFFLSSYLIGVGALGVIEAVVAFETDDSWSFAVLTLVIVVYYKFHMRGDKHEVGAAKRGSN